MSSVSLTNPTNEAFADIKEEIQSPKRRPIPPRRNSGCSSGSVSAGSSWWRWRPPSPACCRCPIPTLGNYSSVQNAGPGWGHLLGTDDLYRDIFSRLVYGARVSLVVGFGGALIGLIVGGIPAMISAYRRGRIDTALNTGSYVVLAFPAIVAVIAIVSFWGKSLVQDHAHHRPLRGATDLPRGAGLDAVLRHPGLRAGRQGARRQRHPHPLPRDPAQHHADHRVLRSHRRGHHRGPGGLARLPRALGATTDAELGQHAERGVDACSPEPRGRRTRGWSSSRRPPCSSFSSASTSSPTSCGPTSTSRTSSCERPPPARRRGPPRLLRHEPWPAPGRPGRLPHARPGQDARHRRRVRLGEDRALPGHHGTAAPRLDHPDRVGPLRRHRDPQRTERRPAQALEHAHRHGVPGPDDVAQPGAADRQPDHRAAQDPPQSLARARPRRPRSPS